MLPTLSDTSINTLCNHRMPGIKKYRTLIFLIAACIAYSANAADFLSYSGGQLYQRFCSGCHGAQAHGDGRIAASLGVVVPDLTLLTYRNRGEFPAERITKIIDGRVSIGKHNEDRTMPIWGKELLRTDTGDAEAERSAAQIIKKIVEYLRSIQSVQKDNK